jgi:hypothetical protein
MTTNDTPRQDFRPADHVRSIASRGKPYRRTFSVVRITASGLVLWAHAWGYICNADPRKWERLPRPEEFTR